MQSEGREGHWGLKGMNERAESVGAQFQIWSTEDKGTDIDIRLRAAIAYTGQNIFYSSNS